MQLGGQGTPGSNFARQHDCAGSITKKHTGCAVFPVQDAAEGFCADHQCVTRRSCADHAFRHRKCVQEPRTYRSDIKSHAAIAAKRMLHDGGRCRKCLVRSGGRQNNQINIGRGHIRRLKRVARRLYRKAGCRFIGFSDMAKFDTGTFGNPFVGCVDFGCKFGV